MYSKCIFVLILLRVAMVTNGEDQKNTTACYGSDPNCGRLKLECSVKEVIIIRNLSYGTKEYSVTCMHGVSDCNAYNATMCCQYSSTDKFTLFNDEHTISILNKCQIQQNCSNWAPRYSIYPYSSYVWIQYDCVTEATLKSVIQKCRSGGNNLPAGDICKYIFLFQHTSLSNIIFPLRTSTPISDTIGSIRNLFTPTAQFYSTNTAEHRRSVIVLNPTVPLTDGYLTNTTLSGTVSADLSQSAINYNYTSVSVTQSSYPTLSISNTILLSQDKDIGTSARMYIFSSNSSTIGSLATSFEALPFSSLLLSVSTSSMSTPYTSSIVSMVASLETWPSASFTFSQSDSPMSSSYISSIASMAASLETSPSTPFVVSISPSLRASQFTSSTISKSATSILSHYISIIFSTSVSSLTLASTLNTLTVAQSFKIQEPTTTIGHEISTKNALNYSRIATTTNDVISNETITHETTTTRYPTHGDDGGNDKGLIVGVAVAVTVLLFVLGVIIVTTVCIRLKRKQTKRRYYIRNTNIVYSFPEDYKDTKSTRSESENAEGHHFNLSQSRTPTVVPRQKGNYSPYSTFNNTFFEDHMTKTQLTSDPIPDLYSTADGTLNMSMDLNIGGLGKEIIDNENTEETEVWNIGKKASKTVSFDPSSYFAQVKKER